MLVVAVVGVAEGSDGCAVGGEFTSLAENVAETIADSVADVSGVGTDGGLAGAAEHAVRRAIRTNKESEYRIEPPMVRKTFICVCQG